MADYLGFDVVCLGILFPATALGADFLFTSPASSTTGPQRMVVDFPSYLNLYYLESSSDRAKVKKLQYFTSPAVQLDNCFDSSSADASFNQNYCDRVVI